MYTYIVTNKHYARHLSQVNEKNAVLASEDICNSEGVVIVAKGLPIDLRLAKRIAQHKLSKAIDHSITIENHCTTSQMYKRMKGHIEALGLPPLISNFRLEKTIKLYLDYACKQPMIRLKLSVLAECLPEVFNRTLVSAGISLALCKELKTDGVTTKNVFLAALLADTGLLHINPEVAARRGGFTSKQWLLYQGHVTISKLFADMVPKLNKRVGRAIMEHHERSDGFGYPLQKFGDELCLEGRILAKVDTIMAVYSKRVLQEGYAFSVVTPAMQFSPSNNNLDVNNAAVRLLYKMSRHYPSKVSQQPVMELIPKLILLVARLGLCLKNANNVLENYQQQMSKPKAKRHVQTYIKLKHSIDTSGLLSDHQRQWLIDVFDNNKTDEFHVVEQFAIMLFEIEYQCQLAQRYFSPLIPALFGAGEDGRLIQSGTDKLGILLNTKH